MVPWLMMAAQALAQKQQQAEARKAKILELQMNEATRLGANPALGDAAIFNHQQANTPINYGAALSMFGHSDGDSKKPEKDDYVPGETRESNDAVYGQVPGTGLVSSDGAYKDPLDRYRRRY